MTACPDENRLLELADGLLGEAEARGMAEHLDLCTSCRGAVVVLARGAPAAGRAPSVAGAPQLPEQLLRSYLEHDAAEREADATRLIALALGFGVSIVFALIATGIARPEGPRPSPFGLVILLAVLAWELGVHFAIRRGFYRPWLPLLDTFIEVSFPFAINLLAVRAGFAADALSTPFFALIAAMLVFSAIRGDARLSMLAGLFAAAQQVVLWLVADGQVVGPSIFALQPHAVIVRAAVMVLSGAAGATLALRFVRRASEALRDIREQDLFGKYLLHEKMGAGGMGEVFRATYCPEGGFVRTVAVKRLLPALGGSARFIEAFRSEARLSATLQHPNLVQVLDCGTFRGAFVVAMELVDGMSLGRLVRSHGPLPPAAVAYVGAELAAALGYLQARRGPDGRPLGLVHCDLNPPNVLLSRIGEVKLADFGVARASAQERGSGVFGGKPGYAAPEQLRGGVLDGRSDLYALGVTLYEALAGRPAFAPGDTALTAPAPSLDGLAPPLVAMIGRLLQLQPEARPPAAEQVRAELVALTGACAPYPHGEALLAAAVEGALADAPSRQGPPTQVESTLSPTTRALR